MSEKLPEEPSGRVEGDSAADQPPPPPVAAKPATRHEPQRPLGKPVTRHEPSPDTGKPATRHEPPAPNAKPDTRHEEVHQSERPRLRRFVLPQLVVQRYDYEWDLSSSGAQADVVLCVDREAGSQVAIKIYRPGAFSMQDITVESLTKTDPEHVVPFRLERDEHQVWEVQEYFPLGSLDDLVNRRGRGSQAQDLVRDVVREVGQALDHIHGLDICHRDLKPQNILVRSEDPLDCVLADFGLAKVNVLSNAIGSLAGTYTYTSPEGSVGRVNKPNDWWGLGVITHELLTGRHLFADHGGEGFLSETRVRAAFFEEAWSYDEVTDPRWRLLLDGLLSPAGDRWNWCQVSEWLAGGSPVAIRHAAGPSSAARSSRRPSAYQIDGRSYTDPAELATSIREDFQRAVDHLAGIKIVDLRAWLHQTSVGTSADDLLESTRLGRTSAVRAAVELQLILDPTAPPVFKGTVLSTATLNEVITQARGGDKTAGTWLGDLREAAALTLLGLYSSDPRLSHADDLLTAWWAEIKRLRDSEPWHDQTLVAALGKADPVIVGTLTAAALDDGVRDDLIADTRRLLEPLPTDVPEALDALRLASAALTVPQAILGSLAVPYWSQMRRAAEEERARRERERQAEEKRQRELRERQERDRRADARRSDNARKAAVRRHSDLVVVGRAIGLCATVLAPWLIGRYALRDHLFRPTGAKVFDTGARDAGKYFLTDWSAGCVVIVLLAAIFLLIRSWRGRVVSVITASAMIAGSWLWLVPQSKQLWQQEEAVTASRLRSTAFPFGDQFMTCGSAEKGFGHSKVDSGDPKVLYTLFSAQSKDSPVSGCNKVVLYEGWRKVRSITFKGKQQINSGVLESPVTVNKAKTKSKTVFTVELTSGKKLRFPLTKLISG